MSGLSDRVLAGDRRALARALTLVEDRRLGRGELLQALAGHVGSAHRVGITGAPGVGKSTLVGALVSAARRRNLDVAVLAVDPSSPLTGGALLGDRIRMTEHLGDPGVFVRSQASRGARGGLGSATGEALDVLDAAGFDLLVLETVGAGQVDVDVTKEAETCLVVFAPGAGDGIQAMKSGLMEVADLWVVNKGDVPEAERLRTEIVQALTLAEASHDVEERVVLVSARTGDGVDDLLDAMLSHRAAMDADGRLASLWADRLRGRLESAVRDRVRPALAATAPGTAELIERVRTGQMTIEDAAAAVLRSAADSLAEDDGVDA